MADADDAPFGRSTNRERLRVEVEQTIEQPLHRADVALAFAFVWNRNAVGARHILVNCQALNDPAERGDIVR